jgi:hypothetical protein
VTRTYVHDNSPSKTARFLRVTGVSPWDQRRFVISAWVFVLLMVFGQSAALGWVLVALSAAAAAGVKIHRSLGSRPVPPVAQSVPVGPAWCDHCADWTVHATEQH